MKNLKPEMINLINNRFNENQVDEVNLLLKVESDRHFINAAILAIALEDNLVYGDSKMIKEFYNIDELSLLNRTDILIAKVITTLMDLLDIDVKSEYEDSFTLDPIQPELLYLIDVVNNHYFS